MPKLSRKPKFTRVISGAEAWWYDDARSIHVLIQVGQGSQIVSCAIKRSELLKYINRSAP